MQATPHITTHTGLVRLADSVTANSRPRTFARKIASMLVEFSSGAWMAFDGLLAFLAVLLAYGVTPWAWEANRLATHLHWLWGAGIFSLAFLAAAHVLGLHDRAAGRQEWWLLTKTVIAAGVAAIVVTAMSTLLFYKDIGRYITGVAALTAAAGAIGMRLVVWRIARKQSERICLLGDASFLDHAEDFFNSHERPVEVWKVEMNAIALETGTASLIQWAKANAMDEIVYRGNPSPALRKTLLRGLEQGVRCSNYIDHLERNYACVPLDDVDDEWFLRADIASLHPQYVAFKRMGDVILSAVGLLLSAPFLLLAALAIKLESRGPVLYRQTRVGLHNRTFGICKLRTMRTDAEKNGAQWAQKNDSRVTRVGRILRITRLDEIPQFLNILKGDMAFIGPRPERPEFVEQLAAEIPYYRQRHLVKPGLTGWAQIHADYGGTLEGVKEKLQFDLYYVKHASLEFDFHICIRTIGAMMKGAR